MNNKEFVQLTADGNYIPVKYAVIEATIGNSLAASYVWLKCIAYGIDTKQHFIDFKNNAEYNNIDPSNLLGTLETYLIKPLTDVKTYVSPDSYNVGFYQIG